MIAIDSKGMLEQDSCAEGSDDWRRQCKSDNFYHTTRVAAWRQTRFKSDMGLCPTQQVPAAQGHLLQGLSYTDFLDRVSTTRANGDTSAVS